MYASLDVQANADMVIPEQVGSLSPNNREA